MSFINDTTAFLVGKNFKGPLILPNISPKKTWSGTISSLLVSSISFILIGFDIMTSFLFSSLFFLGDIFFSHFKRKHAIKDFSNLLIGHGGFLDRYDSILFPIFLISIYNI